MDRNFRSNKNQNDSEQKRRWVSWLQTHSYGLWLLYIPAYLLVFAFLELFPAKEYHIISCPLDRLIPTIPLFFIPYALWWLLFPGALLYFLVFGRKKDFLKLCFILFGGYTVCLLTYFLYPNGIDIRTPLAGSDICSAAIRILRAGDPPQNVCPSMHVSSTVAICLTVLECRDISSRWKRWIAILSVLIILATMFIKQHSVVDVVLGMLLSLLLRFVWRRFSVRLSGRSGS